MHTNTQKEGERDNLHIDISGREGKHSHVTAYTSF